MKRIFYLTLFILFISHYTYSQIYRDTSIPAVLSGVIHIKGSYDPVPGAKVAVRGTDIEIYADARGFFVIPRTERMAGGGNTWLQITAEDFETLDMPVTIGGIEELGIIFMTPLQRDLNPITVNDLRAAGSDVRNQTFSEIGTAAHLFGTNDVLVNAANYNLGALGFKLRGYEWKNTDVYLNGMLMNDPETGYASPVLWDGLNDVTTKSEGSYGLYSSMLYHGNTAGISNLRIRPSEFRKRFKASYSFSNSLYNHRAMATYATGQMNNGWALLISASGRFGNGFADAAKYQGFNYFIAAETDIDVDQKLMLTIAGAPTKRGMQNYSTQEVYDIVGDNFYNSAWGNENGKKRNSRVNTFHQPVISLSHDWDINDWSFLRTTAGVTFGPNSETNLLWTASTADPRPDMFYKLPMEANDNSAIFLNPQYQQIDWDSIRNNNLLDERAKYILAAQHSDRLIATLSSIYDNEISETLLTTVGIQGRYSKASYYNKANDLLGGSYWLDVDQYEDLLFGGDYMQNDLNNPNRRVLSEGRFAYDYDITQIDASLWNKWDMSWRYWDFSISAAASYTSFWRNGNTLNGKFPYNSEGKSKVHNYFNYSVKGRVSYPLFNGYIEANGIYATRAPQYRDVYLMPQISDFISDSKSEKIWGGELNYIMAGAFFNLRISGFYTQFTDQTRTRFYYDNQNISLALTGLNQRHFGGEISMDMKLFPELTIKAAASYGIYKYSSNPKATLFQPSTINSNYSDPTVYMNGLRIGGTPQMAFTAGVMYDSPKKWWVGLNANYAGNNYAEMNPMRFLQEDSGYEQEKLKAAFTLDLYGGYTFNFSDKYFLGINLNAHNLLGTKVPIGAYEPLAAYEPTIYPESKYAARYAYAYGRTIFLIISFRF